MTQIRIVEADQLLPFEELPSPDSSTELTLEETRVVRHPLLVTPMDEFSFLLLDDPAYFQALTRLSLAHLPVQICRPDQISLLPVEAGLIKISRNDILKIASRHSDQMIIGRQPLSVAPGMEVMFDFGEEATLIVHIRHSKTRGCPGGLKSLLRDITRIGRYRPISYPPSGEVSESTFATPVSGRMTLPAFDLEDLRTAAATDDLFPFGITDISPSFRVLDIDFPVSVLGADISIGEKELFLRDLVVLRQQTRRTSSFMGQVFLLNRPT
ncbi:MAG TPA: hypothetical protein PLF13_08705 [candidate division Zixibacteria bacterium]|nr:hypothetical protein [candidate division Zixibacteria bacterium]